MSNITFNVSKKWFNLYKAGVKRKEFRVITPFWVKRLLSHQGALHVDLIAFCLRHNGPLYQTKTFDTVTICLGYPAKDDLERRITYKFVGVSIGYAEAGIGKELMGDERVFVIEMKDM